MNPEVITTKIAFSTHHAKLGVSNVNRYFDTINVNNATAELIMIWKMNIIIFLLTICLERYIAYWKERKTVATRVPIATPTKPNFATKIKDIVILSAASTIAPFLVCLK